MVKLVLQTKRQKDVSAPAVHRGRGNVPRGASKQWALQCASHLIPPSSFLLPAAFLLLPPSSFVSTWIMRSLAREAADI